MEYRLYSGVPVVVDSVAEAWELVAVLLVQRNFTSFFCTTIHDDLSIPPR
jgi:hypothetical protein